MATMATMDPSDYASDHEDLLTGLKADVSILTLPYYIKTNLVLPKEEIEVYVVGAGFSNRPQLYLYCIKVKSSDGFSMKSRYQSRIEHDNTLQQKLRTCLNLVTPNTIEEHKIVDHINE